mmetsp:Transcript_95/g.212  ORF Transcript_95/g.212 Transcript_95/m.212 type:complete len:119 (+) Transcript_95:615-971(+)|eukprot:1142877-Pelagomonas_calceolata.AAC.1
MEKKPHSSSAAPHTASDQVYKGVRDGHRGAGPSTQLPQTRGGFVRCTSPGRTSYGCSQNSLKSIVTASVPMHTQRSQHSQFTTGAGSCEQLTQPAATACTPVHAQHWRLSEAGQELVK